MIPQRPEAQKPEPPAEPPAPPEININVNTPHSGFAESYQAAKSIAWMIIFIFVASLIITNCS